MHREPITVRKSPRYSRVPDIIEQWSVQVWAATTAALAVAFLLLTFAASGWFALGLLLPAFLLAVGLNDINQPHHAILRNYPVLGHARYLLESLRPEFRQYFVEDDFELTPFPREDRAVVYQRAKGVVETLPFGTHHDLYEVGAEWISHSLTPCHVPEENQRVLIGEEHCSQPYSAALLNVSAMSFGSLSKNAIKALNGGARGGGFYHNTGEGGISPHHLEPGGDLVWQVGTGYFGCRAADGGFSAEKFKENARRPTVKMIELKLSQGAKPAHGGILPGHKVTPEIAAIRGVAVGETVHSPPAHTAFQGPVGLLEFLAELRELSGGKPVGFKLCVGNPIELLAIVRAMSETGLLPDFITVDGGEGGTGAAPVEFTNSVGWPLAEGLSLVHNALLGVNLRHRIKIISAGKIATGFHVIRQLALGADLCNSARAMMMALGCIQALKCHTNRCPVGVATQDPVLGKGLVVEDKAERVQRFQAKTVTAALELMGAAGLSHPDHLRPWHIQRRISATSVATLSVIYPTIPVGSLLDGTAPDELMRLWALAAEHLASPETTTAG